jgi:uncharacterized protein YcaQ
MGGEAWGFVAKAPERRRAIATLVERGEMVPVQIEDDSRTYFMLTRDRSFVERTDDTVASRSVAFIAPLDNLLWSRNLIERLFDFKYIWEVYKPAHERRYGYYVLPVLCGDRFVARFYPKLDKEEGRLTILNWYWEPGEELTDGVAEALHHALLQFMAYLGVERAEAAEEVDPAVAALLG